MIENSGLNKKEVNYPADVVFKAIFRNKEFTHETLQVLLSENGINGNVDYRESSTGKFISYTITGNYPSEDILNSICTKVTMVEGFMSLF